MRRKTICFLQHRSGSDFFRHLLGDTPPYIIEYLGLKAEYGSEFHLTTLENKILRTHLVGKYSKQSNIFNTIDELDNRYIDYCIQSHIGDWWGELPPDKIPLPYEFSSPARWSVYELSSSRWKDFKFINLFRDGKNTIESIHKLTDKITRTCGIKSCNEWKNPIIEPEDYFLALCKSWRNKAYIAVDCAETLGQQYKIFFFEDLKSDPIGTMNEIYQFLFNLRADSATIAERAKQINSVRKESTAGNPHSSFNDDTKMDRRWENWSDRELEIYNEICGPVQARLDLLRKK